MTENSNMNIGNIQKNRECFLDRLRVAATCAVVLLHTITGVMDTTDMNSYPLEKTVFLVLMDLITWCVPLFVLISGYLFLNPRREITFRKIVSKYCRRILFALLLFGVPYACMEQVMVQRCFRIEMIVESFLMVCRGETWSHMWYLYLILVLYLVTPALRWLLVRMPKSAVYTLLAFLALGSSILPFLKKLFGWEWMPVLPDGGIYFFYYICGYLFVSGNIGRGTYCEDAHKEAPGQEMPETGMGLKKKSRVTKPKINRAWICVILISGGMICSRLVGEYHVRMAYNYPFTVVISLLLMQIARGHEIHFRQKYVTFFRKLGDLCFAIYLIHPVFLNLLYKGLHISLLDFPIGLSLPCVFLAVLILAAVAAWVLRQIPILRKYVL